MDDCRCPSSTCDCHDTTELYVVSEWEQWDADQTLQHNRRGPHGVATHPSRTFPHGHDLRLVIGQIKPAASVYPALAAGRPPFDYGDAA